MIAFGLAVLVVLLVVFVVLPNSGGSKVTAQFSSAVGIYKNTSVDILGVPVGKVTSVKPDGDHVDITLEYPSKYKIPANAVAVIVANSLVADRYVQLAPAYTSGPVMADHAVIPLARTASPAELDDVYAALDKLSIALGPKGANKNGSLNTLLQVGAANLQGNGAALGNSVQQLDKAATTLANGKTDLFGTVKNLQAFTSALSASDTQVRHFEEQLAQVSDELASERGDLGAALKQLGIALGQVADFVKSNESKVHTDLAGLDDIAGILVKQKSSLNETLAVAPVALSNIIHAYQSDIGAIATRSNLSSLTDPTQLCQLMNTGGLLKSVTGNLLGPLTSQIVSTCNKVIAKLPVGSKQLQLPTGVSLSTLTNLIDQLLGATPVGGLIGNGS